MKRVFYVILFSILFIMTSCVSLKNDTDEQVNYGNPLVMNPIELEQAITKFNDGDLNMCNVIAIHYESLEEPDLIKTVYWFTIGAERGDPNCMWNLGYHFYYIYGDEELGLFWIKKAASNNQENANRFLNRNNILTSLNKS